jgi:hypothetical protein
VVLAVGLKLLLLPLLLLLLLLVVVLVLLLMMNGQGAKRVQSHRPVQLIWRKSSRVRGLLHPL